MRTTHLAGAAAAALLTLSSGAQAAVVIYTYQGFVQEGSDVTGVFGQAGEDLRGLAFTARFRRDDDTPGAIIFQDATDSEISGGTDFAPVRGAITINGVTRDIAPVGGLQSQHFQASCGFLLCTSSGSWEHGVFDDRGGFNFATGVLSVHQSQLDMTGADLPFFPVLFSPDYHTLPSMFGSTVLMTGTFSIFDSVKNIFTQQVFEHDEASGDLFARSLTVTFEEPAAGVPEPAAWGLMLVGFAGAGAALRRSRRAAGPAARGA